MKKSEVSGLIEKRIKSSSLYSGIQSAIDQMTKRLVIMASDANAQMSGDLSELISSGGKRLRPILAFVSSRLGSAPADIIPLMCMLELMHTTSLIHDDVVDGAQMRRDKETINKRRGNFFAVQSGDFLLSKAMQLLHTYKGTGINETLAEVSHQMVMGELLQQSTRYKFSEQGVASYFELINKKTAMLLSASCGCGAVAGGAEPEKVEALYRYGQKLGTAFQLRDDLLDYSDGLGKPPGQDLQNGIFTLPVLTLMKEGIPDSIYCLLMKRDKTEDEVNQLIEYVKGTDVLLQIEFTIKEYCKAAQEELRVFPGGAEKKALKTLAASLAQPRE